MKICTLCKTIKDDFAKSKSRSDGLQTACRDCLSIKNKEHYLKNKEKILLRAKEWKEKNKEHLKNYRIKNKENIKRNNREYKRKRYKDDILFRLICNFRRSVSETFKNIKKDKKTIEMLGVSLENAKQIIELKFKPGMSWENYGKWHIDHIYPISKAKNVEHLKKLFNINNLQPLWAKENIVKSNKINMDDIDEE